MHPLLATMITNAEVQNRRSAADARRHARRDKPEARKFTLRRGRRTPRVAHA